MLIIWYTSSCICSILIPLRIIPLLLLLFEVDELELEAAADDDNDDFSISFVSKQ